MTTALAIAVFVSVSCGLYLALSRDIFRAAVGLMIVGAAANLVLFAAGRLGNSAPADKPHGEQVLKDAAKPLPQAQVLNAIVIGFALICFALVLLLRLMRYADTDDALALRYAEPPPDDPVKPPKSDPANDVQWPPGGAR
jgi:multicomponent Na+:H+ antiporter subunit C